MTCFFFYFSEIASKYSQFTPFPLALVWDAKRDPEGVVNGTFLSLCDSKRQCWSVSWMLKSREGLQWWSFSEGGGAELGAWGFIVWRMCSADDDMTRCSRLYRTSCTLLPFVFCQLPALVRGKAGIQKVCVSECVDVCVSEEGGGQLDTGLIF